MYSCTQQVYFYLPQMKSWIELFKKKTNALSKVKNEIWLRVDNCSVKIETFNQYYFVMPIKFKHVSS